MWAGDPRRAVASVLPATGWVGKLPPVVLAALGLAGQPVQRLKETAAVGLGVKRPAALPERVG